MFIITVSTYSSQNVFNNISYLRSVLILYLVTRFQTRFDFVINNYMIILQCYT